MYTKIEPLSSLDLSGVEPDLIPDAIAMLEKHEGIRSYMYLDSVGVVTTGCGHAIFRSQDAAVLPFRRMKDHLYANQQEIIACWSRLKYQVGSPKISFDKYLYLIEADIEALTMQDIARFDPVIAKTFPVFDGYPRTAKLAIYDMCWECGSFVKWPKLVTAIKSLDWYVAASECYRPQASKERNEDTRDLFLQARTSISPV